MIVESLALRNWRGYRELHRFELDPGLNLVVGGNEAGKSTLFEALARALFDRHTSKARELRAVQPLGSSLGPEVELVFANGDERYRVRKRFLSDASSELYVWQGDEFELQHEGDRADEELRRLLDGDSHRGASRAEHRGLAQALWFLQRETAIPDGSWSEALERGLSALVEVATPHAGRGTSLRRCRRGVSPVLHGGRTRLTSLRALRSRAEGALGARGARARTG